MSAAVVGYWVGFVLFALGVNLLAFTAADPYSPRWLPRLGSLLIGAGLVLITGGGPS